MNVQPSLGRGPRLRISLRNYLLLAAVAGPLLALAYWMFVADELQMSGGAVSTPDLVVQRTIVDLMFLQSRFSPGDRELLCVIVRPSGGVPYLGGSKSPAGISACDGIIYVHGEPVIRKQTPCFLVYLPHSMTVEEIGFDPKYNQITDPQSVVKIPEWQTRVIPALQSSILKLQGSDAGSESSFNNYLRTYVSAP